MCGEGGDGGGGRFSRKTLASVDIVGWTGGRLGGESRERVSDGRNPKRLARPTLTLRAKPGEGRGALSVGR